MKRLSGALGAGALLAAYALLSCATPAPRAAAPTPGPIATQAPPATPTPKPRAYRSASTALAVHGLDGKHERDIELPGIGYVGALSGEPDDREMFLSFTSFTQPPTNFRYDFAAEKLLLFQRPDVPVDTSQYVTEQVWYSSRDGAKVSMFLVHDKRLPKDGRRPTLLAGYGGFNISYTPYYNSADYVFLEKGGIVAVPNLRGGGEYGEEWHKAGMREKKQNVFDDFIAAAQWLIKDGWTDTPHLAIEGASNGGLLVAAVMLQQPELFGAVICEVPVADMLRFHKFTVGRYWILEYGSADEKSDFPFLYKYSPLQNVKDGTAYPATLITTADTDDRVDPSHAKKFGGRLQAADAGKNPILVRVETKAGHGGGKPISKRIEEASDIWTFIFWRLGMLGEPGVQAPKS
jgi:prolyl oligopeptidase